MRYLKFILPMALLIVGGILVFNNFVHTPAVDSSELDNSAKDPMRLAMAMDKIWEIMPAESYAGDDESDPQAIVRPSSKDFVDWYIKDALYNGAPEGVNKITSLDSICGTWKCLVYHDPLDKHNSEVVELANVTISKEGDGVKMILNPYGRYIVATDESFDETGEADQVYTGKWGTDGLCVEGGCRFRIKDFWTKKGKQYGLGTVELPDGVPACVAIVRP